MFIISQIAVFIGFALDISGRLMKNKKLFLILFSFAFLFYSLSYIFLNSYLGALANGVALIRGLIYIFLDNKKCKKSLYVIPIVLLSSIIMLGLLFLWTEWLDILILISFFVISIPLIFKNMLLIRICLIINSILWATYNLTLGAYVSFCCDMTSILICIGTIYLYDIKKSNAYVKINNGNNTLIIKKTTSHNI